MTISLQNRHVLHKDLTGLHRILIDRVQTD